MTVHARSDIAAVTISPAHGGCGDLHSRPVVNGAPAKLWSLTCAPCEDVLRKDSNWSGTISGVPETPDEKEYREDQEVKGRLDQQNQTAEALAKLSSLGDLPAAIAQLANLMNSRPAETGPTCSNCNAPSVVNAKFCGNCGTSMALTSDIKTIEPVRQSVDLDGLTEDQLRELAEERGLKPHHRAGRASLIKLLA